MSTRTSVLRRCLPALVVLATLALPVASTVPPAAAADGDVGYVDFSYGTSVSAPTGDKPQSKLWVVDGTWWGSLYDRVSTDYHIFRFDRATQSWSDTGVLVDERASAHMDALWDGTHLYIVTAGTTETTSTHAPRVVRYSYAPSTRTWSVDAGFPVTLGTGGTEAVTIAKDSTGVLWAVYTQGSKVLVQHTLESDTDWSSRVKLPVPGTSADIATDDIAAVVSYRSDPSSGTATDAIGVMWSNQLSNHIMFARHLDGAADTEWTVEVAYQNDPEGADDHINLKSLQADQAGRIFAAVKTSLNEPDDPLVHLLVLHVDGTWTSHVFGTAAEQHTRPIVLIDTEHRQLYLVATAPCCSGGRLYMKSTSLDDLGFEPGLGTVLLASAANPKINNPTSTKQPLDGTTGLLVLGSDDSTRMYLHAYLDLSTPSPDVTPPEVVAQVPVAGATGVAATTPVSAAFSEALDPTSVTGSALRLEAPGGVVVPATVGYDAGNRRAVLTPTAALAGATTYRAVLEAGGVRDLAGNALASEVSWTFTTIEPTAFADDFESGGFTQGGWVVRTGGAGTATVEQGTSGAFAHLRSTTAKDSYSYIRKDLTSALSSVTVEVDLTVRSQGAAGKVVALAKLYDASGTRSLTLQRVNGTGVIQVRDRSNVLTTTLVVPVGTSVHLVLTLTVTSTADTVTVSAGSTSWSSSTLSAGSTGIRQLRLGDDSTRVAFDVGIDRVAVLR